MQEQETHVTGRGVPGKLVVIGMFAFGILATGGLWTYSRLHNAPFIPLRRALVNEFGRDLLPRVEGGRNRGGPMTLRVVMTVDFDPTAGEPATVERVQSIEHRVVALAQRHIELSNYEFLDINLIQPVPEGEARRHETHLTVADLPPASE